MHIFVFHFVQIFYLNISLSIYFSFFLFHINKKYPILISNKTVKIVFANFWNLFKKKQKNIITQDQINFIRTNYLLYLSLAPNNPKLITTHQIPQIPKLKYFLPTRSTSNLCNFKKKKKESPPSFYLFSLVLKLTSSQRNWTEIQQTRCRFVPSSPFHAPILAMEGW